MKKHWLLFAALSVLLGCAADNNGSDADNGNAMMTNASLSGTYFARLPCSGCNSILVDAVLEADHTYSLAIQNTDDEDIQFENGTWKKDGDRILLTKEKTDADASPAPLEIRILQVLNGRLMLLDDNGEPYPQNAERYLFNKR